MDVDLASVAPGWRVWSLLLDVLIGASEKESVWALWWPHRDVWVMWRLLGHGQGQSPDVLTSSLTASALLCRHFYGHLGVRWALSRAQALSVGVRPALWDSEALRGRWREMETGEEREGGETWHVRRKRVQRQPWEGQVWGRQERKVRNPVSGCPGAVRPDLRGAGGPALPRPDPALAPLWPCCHCPQFAPYPQLHSCPDLTPLCPSHDLFVPDSEPAQTPH